jgi:uncharacterized protein YceK
MKCKSYAVILAAPLAMAIAALLFTTAAVAQTEQVLYNFGGPDGAGPLWGVIAGAKGTFYGTTTFGGTGRGGTVFKLTPEKSGYKEKQIHGFSGSDGEAPNGLVADKQGALYGSTFEGGNYNEYCPIGCGVVFKLTPKKSGYAFSVLYTFQGGTADAWEPFGALVLDKKGALYGISNFGCAENGGCAFKLTPGKSGYTESIIYSFPNSSLPAGIAIDKKGSLFVTTSYDGTGTCDGGCGAVYELTPSGSGYNGTVIYNFLDYADANYPFAPPTIDEKTGVIYGTTWYGGTYKSGTVFELVPSGSDYQESIIYSFDGGGYGNPDGFGSWAPVLLRPDGALYGTNPLGGGGCAGIGCGSIFQLTPSGSGYSFQYIYNFSDPSNGAEPEWGPIIANHKGDLFGTTRSGGSKTSCGDGGPGGALGCGVVFKIVP